MGEKMEGYDHPGVVKPPATLTTVDRLKENLHVGTGKHGSGKCVQTLKKTLSFGGDEQLYRYRCMQ